MPFSITESDLTWLCLVISIKQTNKAGHALVASECLLASLNNKEKCRVISIVIVGEQAREMDGGMHLVKVCVLYMWVCTCKGCAFDCKHARVCVGMNE